MSYKFKGEFRGFADASENIKMLKKQRSVLNLTHFIKQEKKQKQNNRLVARVVIQPLSEETETVISGGVEYGLSFINGKHKITEKRKHRNVEPLAIDDIMPLDQLNPKLCDSSVQTDFQPRKKLRHFSCQTIQTDVIKIKTEILGCQEVSNCGVQTDAQMLKTFSDFSCQTLFPNAMSESLSSAMEFKRRIEQLEQSLKQCRQEATKREEDLKTSELKVKNLQRNLAKSYKRAEMCLKKIEECDKCSGRCGKTTSTSIQTPSNQRISTPVQSRAGTPLSSLHIMQNMFRRDITTTPMNSPMLPTSTTTSRGEIVPYGFIPQINQPSTSFGVQNMMQNANATALVNSPQPTSISPDLISGGEIVPYNFMPRQPSAPRSQITFSVVPQQLIVSHNIGQYNFQEALPPNQSLTSNQKFSKQQHPHTLPMASVPNQQWQHQNMDSAYVQSFQQRHQQLPSLPQNRSQLTNNSTIQVQRDPTYNQKLCQQQLAQQQQHQPRLQVRQDLYQQQSHQHQPHQQQLLQQQRIGTERQTMERLEQAVLDVTKKCVPKKVSVKKYLPKKKNKK